MHLIGFHYKNISAAVKKSEVTLFLLKAGTAGSVH